GEEVGNAQETDALARGLKGPREEKVRGTAEPANEARWKRSLEHGRDLAKSTQALRLRQPEVLQRAQWFEISGLGRRRDDAIVIRRRRSPSRAPRRGQLGR